MVEDLRGKIKIDVVVSPDKGSVVQAREVAKMLGTEVVMGSKKRNVVSTEIEGVEIEGSVEGKRVMMVDDMVNTGGTVVKMAELLREKGAREIGLIVAHWLPVEGNWEKVEKVVDWVMVSNSCDVRIEDGKLTVVKVKQGGFIDGEKVY